MNLLIRADANVAIGTGHVMRCLALAQAVQDAGGTATFGATEIPEALEVRLASEGFPVEQITADRGSIEDAEQAAALAKRLKADWIVLDGYCFGDKYQREVKTSGCKLLVIDDHGQNQSYSADIIVDQNLTAGDRFYRSRPVGSRLLLGTRYAMLRREFRSEPVQERTVAPVARELLVAIGGSDPDNITERVLTALSRTKVAGLNVRILLGAGNPHERSVRQAAINLPDSRVLKAPPNVRELMDSTDIAISAAGSTSWELCFAGVPALLIPVAPNQVPVATELDRRGMSICLEEDGKLEFNIGEVLGELIHNAAARQNMCDLGRELVDGFGSERVAVFMDEDVRLRPATMSDAEMLWTWANDPAVRANSFSTAAIPWEQHCQWLERKLQDPRAVFYIATDRNGSGLGQIRFELESGRAELSISMGLHARGQGQGRRVLLCGVEQLFHDHGVKAIDAFVKRSNERSTRLFTSAGFRRVPHNESEGEPVIHFVAVNNGIERCPA